MYQLRSEETGIVEVETVREALILAEKDKTIWKISFDSQAEERIRIVRDKVGKWVLELMPTPEELVQKTELLNELGRFS